MSDKHFKFTFEGTVDQFKASELRNTYADEVVYITGDDDGNGRAIYANGEYYGSMDTASIRGWRVMRMNSGSEYWNKIVSISSESINTNTGVDAWIEVEANGDTNYPYSIHFFIHITRYGDHSISVSVFGGASTVYTSSWRYIIPHVSIDADYNVWLRLINCEWDSYSAIRPLKQDEKGIITINGKAVPSLLHAANFETADIDPSSVYLEGYGGIRMDLSNNSINVSPSVIDAKSKDSFLFDGLPSYSYAQKEELATINGQSLIGGGDINTGGVYEIQTFFLDEIEVGMNFGQETDEIIRAIVADKDVLARVFSGSGKAKAIYQEYDDLIYLTFCRYSEIYSYEIAPDTGEVISVNVITPTS